MKRSFFTFNRAVFVFFVLTQPSCFVDPSLEGEKRHHVEGEDHSAQRGLSSVSLGQGLCQYTLGRGCFDGYVGFKRDFYVGGRSFFNADDFASHFSELLQVKDQSGASLVVGKDFDLEILTPIDQKSFVSGFEYELVGVMVRSGKIPENGAFSVNDLMDGGGYELRIQRPIQFGIKERVQRVPVALDPSTMEGSPSGSQGKPSHEVPSESLSAQKVYCATLYQDTVVEIRKGMRTYEQLNDFKLYFSDSECSQRRPTATLTL